MQPPAPPEKPEERAFYQRALGMGFTWAASIALLTLGGHWLDTRTGRGFFWTLAGAGLGMFSCGYELWKLWRDINSRPPPPKAP